MIRADKRKGEEGPVGRGVKSVKRKQKGKKEKAGMSGGSMQVIYLTYRQAIAPALD